MKINRENIRKRKRTHAINTFFVIIYFFFVILFYVFYNSSLKTIFFEALLTNQPPVEKYVFYHFHEEFSFNKEDGFHESNLLLRLNPNFERIIKKKNKKKFKINNCILYEVLQVLNIGSARSKIHVLHLRNSYIYTYHIQRGLYG